VGATNWRSDYSAVQDGRLVLFGWLYKLGQPDPQSSQVFGNPTSARWTSWREEVGRDFAADILQFFGVKSLAGIEDLLASDRGARSTRYRNLVHGL